MEKVLIKYYIWFSVLFLLSLAFVGLYTYPQVDDYEYAVKALEKGFIATNIHEYFHWNGRYIATAILSFNPLTWGWLFGYHLIPGALLLLHFFGLRFSLKTFFPEFSSKWIINLTIIGMALYWMRHFALAQDLYWMSGSITHTTPVILCIISFSLLYKNYYQSFSNLRFVLILILTFLIIGFNETVMLGYSFSLFCIFLYNYLQFKKISKSLVFLLLFGAACSAIIIFCPGNEVRAARFEKSHRVIYSISNTITYTIIYSMKFLSPSYIVLLFLFRKKIKGALSKFSMMKLDKKTTRFVFFMFFGFLFVSILPSLWGMGRRPQDRTLSMVMFTYQLLFPILAWHLYNRFNGIFNKLVVGFEKIPKKMIPFLFVVSVCFYNVYDVATEVHKLPKYEKIMSKRFETVSKLQKGEIEKAEFYLTKQEERPYFLVFMDLFGGYIDVFRKYIILKGIK